MDFENLTKGKEYENTGQKNQEKNDMNEIFETLYFPRKKYFLCTLFLILKVHKVKSEFNTFDAFQNRYLLSFEGFFGTFACFFVVDGKRVTGVGGCGRNNCVGVVR